MVKQQIILKNSTNKIALLILMCFFLSGLTGLVYEILWTRLIIKIIGGAPFAVSIVLTVFMGGLGLGAYLASRIIDRITEQMKLVRIYGALQLAIAAYALVIPVLLTASKPLYAILYNRLFSHFMLYNLLTFVGCFILLCIPVICMGATLPVLCRFYVTKLSHLGTHAGRLYGLNTIGAALGALLCGFWLINLLGVWGTLILAVLINGVIGLACIAASYRVKVADELTKAPQESDVKRIQQPKYQGVLFGALIIFAVSGFCAMSYEVIWTKLLGLMLGPTTYSFTIVLVTFIVGLALGSMFFGWLADKTGRAMWLLILTQIMASLFVLGISQLLGNSQLFFAKLIFVFKDQFALLSVVKTVALFAFMILPTFCLGATFPLVSKIYTQSVSRVGRSIGLAYTINTIGAVLGSFCAGFLIIPLFGKETGLSLVIGLQLLTSLVIAVVIFAKNRKGLLKWTSLAVPALAGLVLCFYLPVWNRPLLAQGKYHRFDPNKRGVERVGWLESLLHGPEILTKLDFSELLYYGDGIGGFTTVRRSQDAFGNFAYFMANSGKGDASTRGDMCTQTLLAHLPMLFHRNPKTVMVLGLASGITAGEVLHYPIEQLDVIDINRQVVAASDFFVPWNNNVLSNPKTNLIIQDGRAHLQLTRQKYDVIISEPSNPWMAGLATLFTRDFFALAEDRLNEGGIFVQWLHAYQMDWPTFALVGRTFAQVFPNSLLVSTRPHGLDFLMVGFKGKNQLILDNAEQRLFYTQQSKNVVLSDPRLLYRLIQSEDLQNLFGQGPVNTDNWPRLEFSAPRLMHQMDSMVEENIGAKQWLSLRTKNIIDQVVTDVDAQIDFAAYALSLYIPFHDMVDLSKATPSQKERFFGLMESYCANNWVESGVIKNEELHRRCRSIQIETIDDKIAVVPNKASSYFRLATSYQEMGMVQKGISNWSKLLQIRPNQADAYNNRGIAYSSKGEYDLAIQDFDQAIALNPKDAKTYNNRGLTYSSKGEYDLAIRDFDQAIALHPAYVTAYNNRGIAYGNKGEDDQAIRDFNKTIELDPSYTGAYCNRGLAYASKGEYDQAIRDFEKAVQLAQAAGNEKLAKYIQSQLELYKARRPHRELFTPQDRTSPQPKE